jgi:hypothetical protein
VARYRPQAVRGKGTPPRRRQKASDEIGYQAGTGFGPTG